MDMAERVVAGTGEPKEGGHDEEEQLKLLTLGSEENDFKGSGPWMTALLGSSRTTE